jgi:nucleoside-diphosphate-sugar epimerase
LPNEGKGRCNPVHVDDVIDAMMLAATKEEAIGQNFLISGPDNVSWEYWFRRHEKILGVRSLLLPSDAEFKRLVAQNERKRNLFPVIKSIFTDGTVFMLVKRLMQARLGEVCIKGTIKVVGDMLFMIPGCHHWDQAAKRIVRKLRARATASIAPSLAASDTLVLPADRHITRLYTSPTVVSIDKARTCLGYNPQYSFEDGMTSTDAFIKWASL